MLTFLFFSGIVILILGILGFLKNVILNDDDEPFGALVKLHRLRIVFLVLSLPLLFIRSILFYAEPSHQYYVVHINNSEDAWMSQGYKLKLFAPTVKGFPQYVDVKAPTQGEDVSELEGIMEPVDIRFIDQVTAEVYPAVRFQVPRVEEDFIKFVKKYKTLNNLVYNTLIPTVKEQANNAGYMFTAQDYISGAAQEFRQTFDEMLKDGAYMVRKTEYYDTTFTAINNKGDRGIKSISTRYEVEKVLGADGKPRRIPNEITENKIEVSQVIIGNLIPDPDYQARLKDQKAESAKRQLEQQKIETAKISQQRELAEGELKKTQERVAQEQAQVKTLIAIETKLKEEETNKQLAAIQLETSRLAAQKIKVDADAKAYEIARADGLSEEVKFIELEKTKRTTAIANAIKEAKYPTTLIQGQGAGKNGQDGLLTTLIGAELAKDFVKSAKSGN